MTVSTFVVGDSIALGLAEAMHPTVNYSAKVGIPSAEVLQRTPVSSFYDVMIVSAGSNDPMNPRLVYNLRAIRHKVQARQVIWILPVSAMARSAVANVAAENGDPTVSFKPGPDNVHPKSYGSLAASIKIIMLAR